jgi:hypothetical protein
MGLTILKKKPGDAAGEYHQFRQLQVRTAVDLAYIGGLHLWTRGDKQFSGRHKLIFGPRATAREMRARVFFFYLGKSLSKVASIF